MPAKPTLTARRDIIADALVSRFAAITATGDYTLAWDLVSREPDSSRSLEVLNALFIHSGTETKGSQISNVEQCKLQLQLEAESVIPSDKTVGGALVWNAQTWGEEVLLEMQLALFKGDKTLGSLCINMVELGNAIDLQGYDDKRVSVHVLVEILYRHRLGDPRYSV